MTIAATVLASVTGFILGAAACYWFGWSIGAYYATRMRIVAYSIIVLLAFAAGMAAGFGIARAGTRREMADCESRIRGMRVEVEQTREEYLRITGGER